jgi:hypothetical protein
MTDAANLANLQTRETAITTELAALSSQIDYSLDGQSTSHGAFRKALLEELKQIRELIAMYGGPFEVTTEGTT